jgi:NADPH:quinone reductase
MTSSAMMKALVLLAVGGDFVVQELPRPEPGRGEALVEIIASGVNPLDVKIRLGSAPHAEVTTPAILGIDLAGIVAQVGPGVTAFAAGDEVYGMTGGVGSLQGSLAEFAAVDVNLLGPKPSNLSMVHAAALPLAVITAWEGIIDRGQVAAGDHVLVHGGAGGVGHVAVQLAVARGARVVATGTGASLATIARLGATPVDYAATPIEDYTADITDGEGFDLVFDTVGGAVLDASFTAVRRYTGRVVSILGWGAHSLAPLSFRGASYSGVFTLLPLLTGRDRAHHGHVLTAARQLVEDGQLTPIVAPTTFTWTSALDAHLAVESGDAGGKIVIETAARADDAQPQQVVLR